jgi:hypothetical protein
MLQNFGHPTGQAADNSRAGDDADGDGMTNLHEFLSGTDPHNGASALRIGSVLKSGNDFIVSFPTVLDKLYRVERTDDLATASWTTVIDNIPGTGGSVAISDPGAAAQPKRFYRVKLLP